MKYFLIFLILFFISASTFAIAQSPTYSVAKVQFPDRCYSSVGTGTVIVIDPDMNADPEQIESIPINLWSSRDTDVRTSNAIETGSDTGIFEATVFFNMYDEAFSQRIRVFEGDTLHAKYIDITVPYQIQQEIETFVVMGTLPPDEKWGKYWESLSLQHDSKYVYDSCMAEFIEKIKPTEFALNNLNIVYPAPLKQLESGVPFSEIKCNGNLQLTQRYDNSPACVKSETVFELIKRGWVSDIIVAVQSRDVFLEQDATSSYMEKVIPTLDDFKYTLSESYDINAIFSKFGEPHKDIGSGIHIYVYELNDDTEVWIGYVDDIWYVKHVDSNGNVLEELFGKNEDNIPDQLKGVFGSCACKERVKTNPDTMERCPQTHITWENSTHYIDNIICEWREK